MPLKTVVKRTSALRYEFQVEAQNASLTETQNTVDFPLAVGDGFSNSNNGAPSVTAQIFSLKMRGTSVIQ